MSYAYVYFEWLPSGFQISNIYVYIFLDVIVNRDLQLFCAAVIFQREKKKMDLNISNIMKTEGLFSPAPKRKNAFEEDTHQRLLLRHQKLQLTRKSYLNVQ